jgi:predicted ATPase
VARAEDNPFFAEELLLDAESDSELPETVHHLLMARMEQVSERAWEVLSAAAVIGRRFAHQLVAAVAGLPTGELESALRETVTAQALVVEGDGYSFRHALMQEVAYGRLLPSQRRELHGRVAAALAQQPDDAIGSSAAALTGELAYHWRAAGRVDEGFVASLRAARAAERAHAPAEAHLHYRWVLDTWSQVASELSRN